MPSRPSRRPLATHRPILRRARALGLQAITLDDPRYPVRLRAIDLPPPVLFIRGELDALEPADAVAIVGTRRPTEAGRRTAARIATAVAELGATIVSGLALGIDGAAHAAAVAADRPTVAVIGGGHARLYPRVHERLAERIVAGGGAIVSEFAPDTEPTRGTFPRRNRLISGLSDSTVVVEAGARSGALTTAAWALEQGRRLFLVPGPIDAPTVAGCLAFLRELAPEARIVAGDRRAARGPGARRRRRGGDRHAPPAPRDGPAPGASGSRDRTRTWRSSARSSAA